MANEIKQDGFGNNAFQGISDSNINVTQIIGVSPEFANMKTQLHDMEQLLALLPEDKEQERSELSARIYKHKELIESFKADVLKLAESFSHIEINTERLRRAKEHFDKGEIAEARVVLEDALEEMADEKRGLLAKKKEFEEDIVPKLQSKADEYLILAQTTALNYESSTHIKDAKSYFTYSIECRKFYENLNVYANFLEDHSEFHAAIECWRQALEIAQQTHNKKNEGDCLGNLGVAHKNLGQYQKAIEFYKKRLTIAREIGDRKGEGRGMGNLGVVYELLGEVRTALKFHEQALQIAREIGDRQGEANGLGNIGIDYKNLGEHQKAIYFQEQALTILRETGDRQREGQSLGNLGLVYDALGEYETAIEFYMQRLDIAREISDRRGEGKGLGNLGMTYHSLGEYQKAIEFHEQKLKIVRETGNRRDEGSGLANIGLAYNKLGETEKACNYWRQALAIYKTIGVPQEKKVREWIKQAGCPDKEFEKVKLDTD